MYIWPLHSTSQPCHAPLASWCKLLHSISRYVALHQPHLMMLTDQWNLTLSIRQMVEHNMFHLQTGTDDRQTNAFIEAGWVGTIGLIINKLCKKSIYSDGFLEYFFWKWSRWLEGVHHWMDCPLEHHEPASLYTQYTNRVNFISPHPWKYILCQFHAIELTPLRHTHHVPACLHL